MKNSILLCICLSISSLLMGQKPSTQPTTTTKPGSTIDMSKISNRPIDPGKFQLTEHSLLSINKNGIRSKINEQEGSNKEEKNGPPIKSNDNQTGFVCTTQKIKFSESNFERIIAGGIDEKIYPGAFYNGLSILDGSWKPYIIQRSPMKISLVDVSAIPGNPETTIIPSNDKIDRSNVSKGLQTILTNNRYMRNSAANLFTQKEIHSEQQLNIYAGGSFSGWGAQAKATFNLDKKTEQQIIICKLTQKYFTIDVPTQNSLELLKDPNNNQVDNDAIYISSVSYGRIGYLSIKSSLSTEKIKATVEAIYNNPTMSAEVEASLGISNFLSTSEINGFTYGGNPITVTSIKDFARWVHDGDIRDNGLAVKPIFYKTKFIKSGKDAYVSMATDFNEIQCEPYNQFVLTLRGPSLQEIHNNDCRKAWGTVDAEVWETTPDGTLERQIFPLTDNGRIENVTRMMDWPNNGQVTNINEVNKNRTYSIKDVKDINSVNKVWNYKINPEKINNNQAVVIVKTYLGSQHKWSDMSDDYTPKAGMGKMEIKRIPIKENIDKEVEVGPYSSPYRPDHIFRAHFKF